MAACRAKRWRPDTGALRAATGSACPVPGGVKPGTGNPGFTDTRRVIRTVSFRVKLRLIFEGHGELTQVMAICTEKV
jgi:hypothetical protein